MKRISLLALAVTGLLIVSTSGIAMAGWGYSSEPSSGSEMKSMEATPEEAAPQVGTFEHQEAEETGSLPGGEKVKSSSEPFSSDLAPDVDIGGFIYRGGTDTQ